eukprot:3348220-Ditylum_brightwellii.AAC.1
MELVTLTLGEVIIWKSGGLSASGNTILDVPSSPTKNISENSKGNSKDGYDIVSIPKSRGLPSSGYKYFQSVSFAAINEAYKYFDSSYITSTTSVIS